MTPGVDEQHNVSLVGYHDLEDRPAFKIALQRVDEKWLVYLGHFWHRGWSIVNVTDPQHPELLNFIKGPENTVTKQIQVADGRMITALERPSVSDPVEGEPTNPAEPYKAGAYIWDVEVDPVNPEFCSYYETGGRGTHRNYYSGGKYAFMSASPAGYEPEDLAETTSLKNFHLRILDVSDPENPVEVGEWMAAGQDATQTIEPQNYFHGPAYVTRDRAYLSYGRVGAVTLDMSTVSSPEELWTLDFGDGIGSGLGVHSFIPVPDTDLAVVNSEAILEGPPTDHTTGEPVGYTFILDIADEAQPSFDGKYHSGPRVISWLPLPTPEPSSPFGSYYDKPGRFGPHNQHHHRGESIRFQSSEYIVMTYFNAGLRIFDISNPSVPSEAGYYVPEIPDRRLGGNRPRGDLGMQLEDVVVDSRGVMYCTDPNYGLFILESSLF